MRYFKDIPAFVTGKMVFCGIDMHEHHWNLCFLCDGEVVEEFRIAGDFIVLLYALQNYSSARQIRIVYEAGFSGFWVYRKLRERGYDCMVTPPSLIPQNNSHVKTNKRDARALAHYFAGDLLKAVYVPPVEVEADRRVVRRRRQLSKQLTRAKNHISSFLHLHGLKTPSEIRCKWSKRYVAWLTELTWEQPSDGFTFKNLLTNYQRHRDDLAAVTHQLREMSTWSRYAVHFKRLRTARGVGLITGMTFLLEIFDFGRFRRAEEFASYLGLTPAQYSTGDKVRLGHITRQGNAALRGVLVESAWTVIRHDPHLRAKYERLRQRGTNGKKAIVAVAHSLALRLRRCLLDETDYVIGVC
jgi:transposase